MSAHYRFYLLRADDHIARRREDYFADDAAAIAAAGRAIGDYPGIEIWCERRKVVTLSVQDVARLHTPAAPRTPYRAAMLISRNNRLIQQAANTRRRTEALHARATAGSRARAEWALRRSCRLTPSLCEDCHRRPTKAGTAITPVRARQIAPPRGQRFMKD